MANVNLGKVSITPKGTWNNTNEYEKLDVVYYNGSGYIAVINVPTGIQITNTNYWMLLVGNGENS